MATATITLKKGTTAEWTESKRVLDDGELGLETTTSGHRIIRIGNGSTEFMSLPVAFDIEEVREIKTGMDKDAKTYYDDMVKKGTELLAEMKAQMCIRDRVSTLLSQPEQWSSQIRTGTTTSTS